MKLSQLRNLSILFFILTQTANSQELWATTAAEALVSRNSSNYTAGQITYKDQIKKPSSTLGDVQYVYNIFSLNLHENKKDFDIKLFPNASSSNLLLEVNNYKNDNLSYQISDLHGKVLEEANVNKATITNDKTQINVILLPVSSYILTVFEIDKKVESFKITKTNKIYLMIRRT